MTALERFHAACFALAVVHTLACPYLQPKLPARLRWLSDVEFTFALWALPAFLAALAWGTPLGAPWREPVFVLAILIACATPSIRRVATLLIEGVSRVVPAPRPIAFFWTSLVVGPLLGSLITEPAAMAITATLLSERFLGRRQPSEFFLYAMVGLLFVNVSVGGTLTPYAAPPILMVAQTWGWDLGTTWSLFGMRAIGICVSSATLFVFVFRSELTRAWVARGASRDKLHPAQVIVCVLLTAMLVRWSHFPERALALLACIALLHRGKLQGIRQAAGVAVFLLSLSVLGSYQRAWLAPLISDLSERMIFLGSVALTSVLDNAALTYLGAQAPSLSEKARYLFVAGSVTGGGLTLIANAPNIAGYEILRSHFGAKGMRPFGLLLGALVPTLIALAVFGGF